MSTPTTHDVTTGTTNTNAQFTVSMTVSAGSDRMLVVALFGESSAGVNGQYTGVTFGGVAMTKVKSELVSESGAGTVDAEFWYLINPAVSTASIVASATTYPSRSAMVAFTLHDAAATAPESANSTSTIVDGTTMSLAISSVTNEALILSAFATNNLDTQTSGQSIIGTASTSSSRGSVSSFAQAVAGPKTMDWTASPTYQRACQVNMTIRPAGAGVPLGTLTQTEIANGRVFPRNRPGSTMAISASYTEVTPGDTSSVEYRVQKAGVDVVSWTAVSGATISGGSISGSVPVPATGGPYKLDLRTKTAGGVVIATAAGSNTWGVGKIILHIGSSTLSHWFFPAEEVGETPDPLLSKFTATSGTWGACTGGGAIAFGNALIGFEPGVPVALIDAAVSGTTISAWNEATDAGYIAMKAAVTAVGGVIEGANIHVGSNDARNELVVSRAAHAAGLRQIVTLLRSDFGAGLPVCLIGCQRAPLEPSSSDIYWQWARGGEQDVMDDAGNFTGSLNVDLALGGDQVHVAAADTQIMGRRVARAWSVKVLGGSLAWHGPKPVSCSYNSGTGKVRVVFQVVNGTGIVGRTGPTGVTGFRVSTDDFATLQTISAAAIVSPTDVELTVSTGLSGVKVDYLGTHDPDVSNCIYDNASAPA